ncbi:MAG: PAS domain S-box protein [Candidatus Eremiobacterota bacterium]
MNNNGHRENDFIKQYDTNGFIAEHAGDVIWILDLTTGMFKYVSPSVERLRGFTQEEVMKQSIKEVLTEESFRFVSDNLQGVINEFLSGNTYLRVMTHELDQKCKNGSVITTEVVVTLLKNNKGQVTEILGISRDITARKKTEEALRKSEEKYRKIFENIVEGIFQTTPAGKFITVNPSLAKMFGYSSPEEMISSVNDIDSQIYVNPGERLRFKETLAKNNKITGFELEAYKKNGQKVWHTLNAYTVRDKNDAILYYEGTCEDITARKEMEEALKIEKLKLETASLAGKVGLWTWHIETGIIEWSGSISSMLYYNPEELSGSISLWKDIIHPDDRERVMVSLNNHLKENTRYRIDYRIRRKDGTYTWWLATGSTERDSDGNAIKMSGACVDITERKLIEEELMKTRALFKAALEQSPVGITIVDWPDMRFCMVNNTATRITGIRHGDYMKISGKNIDTDSWELFYPDGRKCSIKDFPLTRSILNGEFIKDELMIIKRASGITRYIIMNSAPVFNDRGDIIAGICIFPDVTEARKAEEEKLEMEKKLLHAQKLESLGILAGGIAHDFNNLLMALLGNLELARMDISPFSPAVTYIDGALQASRRAADLTRQMLAYSGKGRFVISPINLNELVEENYHLFKASLSKSAILKLELSANLPHMEGDPGQIQQIIMNLITNASEAIGDKSGVITLATGMENCENSYLIRSRLKEIPQAGTFVYIEVKDTGCGMDKKTQDKLFDPFFTTKFTGRGLGMSAVIGIVKSHRGAIMVDSIRDSGTSIKVFFPVCHHDTGDIADEKGGALPFKSMDGTILLVDDEDIILATSEIILQRLGFRVITASDGEKAIQIFAEQSDKIDCIIMDLSMPKMDGLTAFKEIINIKPDVKIILSSGYNEEESVKEHTDGLAGFLEKPYQIEELQKILQKTLEKQRRTAVRPPAE